MWIAASLAVLILLVGPNLWAVSAARLQRTPAQTRAFRSGLLALALAPFWLLAIGGTLLGALTGTSLVMVIVLGATSLLLLAATLVAVVSAAMGRRAA